MSKFDQYVEFMSNNTEWTLISITTTSYAGKNIRKAIWKNNKESWAQFSITESGCGILIRNQNY